MRKQKLLAADFRRIGKLKGICVLNDKVFNLCATDIVKASGMIIMLLQDLDGCIDITFRDAGGFVHHHTAEVFKKDSPHIYISDVAGE